MASLLGEIRRAMRPEPALALVRAVAPVAEAASRVWLMLPAAPAPLMGQSLEMHHPPSALLAEQLALQPRRGRLATNERTEYEPRE